MSVDDLTARFVAATKGPIGPAKGSVSLQVQKDREAIAKRYEELTATMGFEEAASKAKGEFASSLVAQYIGGKKITLEHEKDYGVYHWDTFDDTTLFMGEGDTVADCCLLILNKYSSRIVGNGADRVEIVDQEGNIVVRFNIS
ncbi:MAG: hypothetical protein ACXADB_09655 [Candidatus Hermodarchaeia archaeon]|jgi:hypothetical protein